MSFAETYELEVLHSRKIRAQRAFFWARVIGIVLMLTIAVALRADPQLRSVLMRAGMNGVSQLVELKGGGGIQTAAPAVAVPESSTLPKARIKINRPGDGTISTGQNPDMNAIAAEIARTLNAQRVGYD